MIIELESVLKNRSWLILSTTRAFASEEVRTITWNLDEVSLIILSKWEANFAVSFDLILDKSNLILTLHY